MKYHKPSGSERHKMGDITVGSTYLIISGRDKSLCFGMHSYIYLGVPAVFLEGYKIGASNTFRKCKEKQMIANQG